MCGILGAFTSVGVDVLTLFTVTAERGRDSWGYSVLTSKHDGSTFEHVRRALPFLGSRPGDITLQPGQALIGNLRAEPTTEWVRRKTVEDVHPFVSTSGDWSVVHNGTIANDKALAAMLRMPPPRIDSAVLPELFDTHGFEVGVRLLKGSFAILAINRNEPDSIYIALNYRPLYTGQGRQEDDTFYIASTPEALAAQGATNIHPLNPYRMYRLRRDLDGSFAVLPIGDLQDECPEPPRTLVVASGGMDSTVAACLLRNEGHRVELLHFNYNCRAQKPETKAIRRIADALGVPLHVVATDLFTQAIGGSNLTNTKNTPIADGEAGAEFAHEWVPARNLVLLSIAVAIAESKGFDYIALGNNLEEAGAYPDNEPEFIRRLNAVLPFATGVSRRVRILQPVGNMMKHEIVATGTSEGAPLHLTWSCYNAASRHCGKCGPCFMRRTAYLINGIEDPMEYES